MPAQRPAYATDVSDEEWQLLAPLLPPEKSGGRPRKYPRREVINGIQYILRGGCAWRLMPHDLPQWQTAYQTSRLAPGWHLAQDSRSAPRRGPHPHGPSSATFRRDHRCANGQNHRKRGAHGYDGAKKLNGRKRHFRVETTGLLLRVLVHPADLRDAEMAPWLLATTYAAFERL